MRLSLRAALRHHYWRAINDCEANGLTGLLEVFWSLYQQDFPEDFTSNTKPTITP